MAVSSKSIIHYTDNLDNLKGIINDGSMRLKYCAENIHLYADWDATGAFPMICFCDLPLTLAKEHIAKYGSYGIGFSKIWAYENHLNPVLYLEKNSSISQYLTDLTEKYMGETKRKEIGENADLIAQFNKDLEEYARILAFCKNHAGPLVRRGVTVDENYVFYDEREWRYVPAIADLNGNPIVMNASEYNTDRSSYNSLLSGINLRFDYSDISYIIVKNEEDIQDISLSLTAKYSEAITPPHMRKLLTKIISVTQIHDDF